MQVKRPTKKQKTGMYAYQCILENYLKAYEQTINHRIRKNNNPQPTYGNNKRGSEFDSIKQVVPITPVAGGTIH